LNLRLSDLGITFRPLLTIATHVTKKLYYIQTNRPKSILLCLYVMGVKSFTYMDISLSAF